MDKFLKLLNEAISPNIIDDAINNRYRILINYDDEENHATGIRLVEPYVLGYTKANNIAFRGYQYQGDTVRGIPKWKLFRLDRVIDFKPTNQHFNAQPKDNGWSAQNYNDIGDGSMIRVINQVKFDNTDDEVYSPRLNDIRRNIDNIRRSEPIKIDDFNGTKKKEPVETDTIKDIIKKPNKIDTSSDDFQKMLNRNLAITDREKAKRGFSLNKKKDIENSGSTTNPIVNDTIDDIVNKDNINEPIVNVSNDNTTSNNNDSLSDFQKMLNRNLAITDKEKAKRGFSLKNKR